MTAPVPRPRPPVRRLFREAPARLWPALASAALLVGCGRDPILDRAESLDDAPAPAAGSSAGKQTRSPKPARPQPRELGGPTPGTPPEPTPGAAAEPGPGRPDAPQPGVPDAPPPGSTVDGPVVQLSGQVQVSGGHTGTVRLDVFDGDQRAAAASGTPPKVVAQARLEGPGPFSLAVPMDSGQVWIGGYVDVDGNGRPSRDEPSGWLATNPVETAADVSGLTLELSVEPPPGSPE